MPIRRPLALAAAWGALAVPALASAPPAVLSFDEAVHLGLRQSPALEVARREHNVALIEVERSRPRLRPDLRLTLSSGLGSGLDSRLLRSEHDLTTVGSSSLALSLDLPLYQFGAGKAPTARGAALAATAGEEYRKAELDLVLQVREACVGVLRAEGFAAVARQGTGLARENTRTVRLLVNQGLKAEVDVLDAERAEAQAEASALQAEHAVALARAALNRVLGREVDDPVAVRQPPLPGDPEPLAALRKRALAQRPEAAALRGSLAAAEAGTRLARAGARPRVDFSARYSVGTGGLLAPGGAGNTGFLVSPRHGAAATLNLVAPLTDAAGRRFAVRESEERAAQLRASLTALEGGIALELEQQRLAMAEARALLAVAARSTAAAEKAYEITRLRAELGRAVGLEVLASRQGLERALTERAAAEADLLLAHARLERALGNPPPARP